MSSITAGLLPTTLLRTQITRKSVSGCVEVEAGGPEVGEQALRQAGRGHRGVDDEEAHQQQQQVAVDLARACRTRRSCG